MVQRRLASSRCRAEALQRGSHIAADEAAAPDDAAGADEAAAAAEAAADAAATLPPPGQPAPAPPAPARKRAHVVVSSDEDEDEHSVTERRGEHAAVAQFDEEEADDALVPLPPPERCRELVAGGALTGDALEQRNARIDEDLGRPFRLQAHPAEGLLAVRSQKRDAMAARRALLLRVQLHVVRLARLAGVGPCASHLDFGKARGPTGAALGGTLWTVAAACLSHVPALSDKEKVKKAFVASFPSGMQAAPEWSSRASHAPTTTNHNQNQPQPTTTNHNQKTNHNQPQPKNWGQRGIEPRTSSTLRRNHTTRPLSRSVLKVPRTLTHKS